MKKTAVSIINFKSLLMGGVLLVFCTARSSAQEIKEVKITELEKIIKESTRPLVVNFWATWCRPCIEEIPWFQRVVSSHQADSVELILVSVDYREEYPAGIENTAAKRNFTATIYWLNETNADYFCPRVDPKWSGAVPATLFVNNKTGYRKFMEEQVSREKLDNEIKAILQTHQ